ncbi:hypothetical protein KESI111651_02365 [Kerstersia similis]
MPPSMQLSTRAALRQDYLPSGKETIMIKPSSPSLRPCQRKVLPAKALDMPVANRQIRSRDDLSFTRRDAGGRLINWMVPQRAGEWHAHYGIGENWFDEIVQLARHDPEEAYTALRMAGPLLLPYMNFGHAEGFFNSMAQWAVAGILTAQGQDPALPFKLPSLGDTVHPGMPFYRQSSPDTPAP